VEADGAWPQEKSSRDALRARYGTYRPRSLLDLASGANSFDSQPEPVRTLDCSGLFFKMNFSSRKPLTGGVDVKVQADFHRNYSGVLLTEWNFCSLRTASNDRNIH
jgi:hypothetical protein